jgi:hypothetical protein
VSGGFIQAGAGVNWQANTSNANVVTFPITTSAVANNVYTTSTTGVPIQSWHIAEEPELSAAEWLDAELERVMAA